MRPAAMLAALALAAVPAVSQEEPPQEDRIWKGTLGDTAITVCFADSYDSGGVYYEDAQLVPIRLMREDAAGPQVLREPAASADGVGPVWTLDPASGDRMTGAWRQGETAQPIRLRAVPAALPDYGTACESAAFLDPLLAGGTTTRARASFAGTAYTTLAYQGPARAGLGEFEATSFALDPLRPGDAAINAALAKVLPDGSAAHPMGQCVGMTLGGGTGGYSSDTLEPTLIAPRWLGVRQSGSSYCGGAHPNHFTGFAIHDRETGAQADPSRWFRPGALAFYEFPPEPGQPRPVAGFSAALRKAIEAHWPRDDDIAECADMVGNGDSWSIGLTREGPVFVPQLPHAVFACTEEVTLPWKAARRFLSPEGRAVMASLK